MKTPARKKALRFVVISGYVSQDLRRKIQRLAERREWSMSQIVAKALKEFAKRRAA